MTLGLVIRYHWRALAVFSFGKHAGADLPGAKPPRRAKPTRYVFKLSRCANLMRCYSYAVV